MALSLTIGVTDRVAYLQSRSLTVTTTNGARTGRCDFILIDYTPGIGQDLVIADGATTYFDGTIYSWETNEWTTGHWFTRVTGIDAGAVPAESHAPFSLTDRSATETYHDVMAEAGLGQTNWWQLSDASGTTAVDHYGVQDGTYVDTPTLGATGPIENTTITAVTFNGSSEYVTCGTSPILSGKTSLTIAAWFKTATKAATQAIYSERDESDTSSLVRLTLSTDGRPFFTMRGTSGTLTSIGPTTGDWADDAWHWLVVTMVGSAIEMYVDGAIVKSGTKVNTNTTAVDNVRIGADFHTGDYFTGSLADVMTYNNRAIPQDEAHRAFYMVHLHRYVSCRFSWLYDAVAVDWTKTAIVETYQPGLGAGMTLGVTSASAGLLGFEMAIQEIETSWPTADLPRFRITAGDTPYHLAASSFP